MTSSSCSHATQTHRVFVPPSYDMKSALNNRQYSPEPFFAPVLQGLLLVTIVLAILLVMIFCTQPMTLQTLISDFWAGVEGINSIR